MQRAIATVVVAVVLAGCGAAETKATPTPTPAPTPSSTPTPARATVSGTLKVDMRIDALVLNEPGQPCKPGNKYKSLPNGIITVTTVEGRQVGTARLDAGKSDDEGTKTGSQLSCTFTFAGSAEGGLPGYRLTVNGENPARTLSESDLVGLSITTGP